jgi:S-methylmethionine-dependent homocysteine/selenocysteine methylase
MVKAAQAAELPVAIGFTVETDGRLPSGIGLAEAIEGVDAETGGHPAYYMINCAHPTHFQSVLKNEPWTARIQALRANASVKSHAELDESTELDDGNPEELSEQYWGLTRHLKNLNVLGGCCGTDHRHVAQICGRFASQLG